MWTLAKIPVSSCILCCNKMWNIQTNIKFLWLCRLVTHNGVSFVFTGLQKQVQPQGTYAWRSWRWSRSIFLPSVWEAGEEQELLAGSPVSTPSGPQKHTPFSYHTAQDPIADTFIGCDTIIMFYLLHRTGLLKTNGEFNQ